MDRDTAEFRITVTSPHGKRSLSQFRHWMAKVSDEAKERWGIDITIERLDETESEHAVEFTD